MPLLKEGRKHGTSDTCVFISYSHEDRDSAVALAQMILVANVSVYLDSMDKRLGVAVSASDDEAIVDRIEHGLKRSTHLIAVISEATKNSWWVPFEIGAARTMVGGNRIAALVLDEIDELPSFLKVATMLEKRNDWIRWLVGIEQQGGLQRLVLEKRASEQSIPRFGSRETRVRYR